MNPALPGPARKEFQRAVALFNEGRLATAEGICTELLARHPQDAEIAHFGGLVANRMGRYEVAVDRLSRCVRVEPQRARAHAALAFAHDQLGRLEEARRAFAAAIQADPGFAEAHNGLGVTMLRAGHPQPALVCFERAIALEPRMVEARLNAARVLQETGRGAAAAQAYREALALAQGRPEVIRLAALGLQQAGDADAALDAFRALLAAVPDDAVTRSQYALALETRGRGDEALREIATALEALPPSAMIHNASAILMLHRQRWNEARDGFRSALALEPAFGDARVNLAMALRELGARDEARAEMRAASAGGKLDALALARLAAMYGEIGESDESIELAERSIRASPFLPEAHLTLAIELLRTGALERGWREHVYRPSRGNAIFEQVARGEYPPPLPASLAGKDVVIVAEQGLGDALFFLRFARPLADAGARLHVMNLDPRLEAPVVRALPIEPWPVEREVPRGTYALWAGDLPRFVRPLTGSDTCASLSIAPLPERVARMRQRLGESRRARIGVAWRAGTPPKSGPIGHDVLHKEIAPEVLGAALAGLPVEVVSIQRAASPESVHALEARLGAPIVNCSDVNGDIEDMLALLSLLDDYAGVSSTNVHLRAALGRGGRILVPFPADWRWQSRGESPWFERFRTYRQEASGDWSGALAALHRDLVRGETT